MDRKYSKKTGLKKKAKAVSVTKVVKEEIKQQSYKAQETKSINVPDATIPAANTVALTYPSASGLQYLAIDMFRVPRGTDDGTAIGAANRLGDSVYALGIQMNYTFMSYVNYVSPALTTIPFVRLRIICFQAKSAIAPPPGTSTLLDSNFLGTGAFTNSTMQPINYNAGFVKRILYDKVKIIRPANNTINASPPSPYPQSEVYTFNKYINLGKKIKYTTLAGEPTEEPIHLCIIAETDNSTTFMASGSRLLLTSGFSRCYYKDG